MKIDRLISIIMTLNNNGRVSAKELARKYEVSIKTIQRDIEAIERSGVPIASFKGKDGGYEIFNNYKINNTVMNKSDIYLISTLIDGLSKSYEFKELNYLKEKFELLEKSEINNNRFIIDFDSWGNSVRVKEKLRIIDKCILESKKIEFDYNDINGILTHRIIEPMKLIFKGFSWYIYGYCIQRKDFRVFKIRRIKNLIIKESYLKKREPFINNIFKDRSNDFIGIKLKCTENFLNRIDDYFEEYRLYKINNNNILEVSLPEDEWLYSMLLGIGTEVEIMEPLSLRNLVKDRIYKMNEVYK